MALLTPEQHEAKRQARYERLIAAAEKAERESAATWNQKRKDKGQKPWIQNI